MTPITINELDPIAPVERMTARPPRLRRIVVVGAFALGGVVGAATGFSAAVGESSHTEVPAASSPALTKAPLTAHDARFGSADTIARRVEGERQHRIEACSSSPRSADALERCILGR